MWSGRLVDLDIFMIEERGPSELQGLDGGCVVGMYIRKSVTSSSCHSENINVKWLTLATFITS